MVGKKRSRAMQYEARRQQLRAQNNPNGNFGTSRPKGGYENTAVSQGCKGEELLYAARP
jgi:hypothetical protein